MVRLPLELDLTLTDEPSNVHMQDNSVRACTER